MTQEDSFVVTLCVSDIKPEPVEWLWPQRAPLGKITNVSGDPGLGKSVLMCAMAAPVTLGGRWPVDDTSCPQGSVIMLSAEDDPADTIRPRLDAAGADVSFVHILKMVCDIHEDGKKEWRSFSLKRDIEALGNLLGKHKDCRLITIDPMQAYLDGTDSHRNSDVRSLLMPLKELAERNRVAIVCVDHLNKGGNTNSLYRSMGSIAFIGASRAAYAVARDKDDPKRRLFLPQKNNLAPESQGLAFTISSATNGAPILLWDAEPVTITADEALSPHFEDEQSPKRSAAQDWLRDLLRDGPLPANEVREQAEQSGQAWATVRRAQDALGIKPTKTRFDGQWTWSLPKDAQGVPHDPKVSTLGGREHLGVFPEEKGMFVTDQKPHFTEDAQDAHAPGVGHLGEPQDLPRWLYRQTNGSGGGWSVTNRAGDAESVRAALEAELQTSVEVRPA